MSLNCYYHPEREVNTKCENCGKLICVKCKMIFQKAYDRMDVRYYKSYEYCPICFYDKNIVKYRRNPIIIAMSFTIMFTILIIGISSIIDPSSESSIFLLFPIVISVIFIIAPNIYAFIYCPRKVKEFKEKKEEFLQSIKPIPPIKEN
ncbi:MAG: hypothetical protein ACFFDN_28450 [Candidatus Hodarchaeota archaeon]